MGCHANPLTSQILVPTVKIFKTRNAAVWVASYLYNGFLKVHFAFCFNFILARSFLKNKNKKTVLVSKFWIKVREDLLSNIGHILNIPDNV